LTNVHLHQAALTEKPGVVSFTTDRGAGNRIQRDDDARHAVQIVRATTLDEALTGMYAMAKLDLEGAEFLALKGAKQNVEVGNPPVWLLELVDRFLQRFDGSVREVTEWLAARGYELARYDVDRNSLRIGRIAQPNVFAVYGAAVGAIETRLAGATEPSGYARSRAGTRA
jgi:hypothetical protein